MVISDRLKKVIFKKLYEDLSNVEIIPYEKSIWFIDRENEYWYFKLSNKGVLYWRYQFFLDYFSFFSIDDSSLFEPIISEWVEEVLNRKVVTTNLELSGARSEVKEVLNCKVVTTEYSPYNPAPMVKEVLNCKVVTTWPSRSVFPIAVEEVLNCKVVTTQMVFIGINSTVEEVLNCKVVTTQWADRRLSKRVEEILNQQ
jgi:hypothetical protein